jgi:starch-binding outer membrane protein SusE/F
MRNIFKKSIFALAFLALGACEVEDKNVIAIAETPAKLLTPASGTTLVLSPGEANKTIATLVWDFSKNGVDSPASYVVEIAKSGTNFKDPIFAGKSDSKFVSWTVEQLNNVLDPTIFVPFQPSDIDVRVKSLLGNGANAMIQYSNIIKLKVTPYSTALPKIAVPGNHQGWTPSAKDVPLLAASGFGKTNFEGYVSLDGEFKFLTPKTNGTFDWGTPDFGDDGTFSGILLEDKEVNCTATKGYYRVYANIALTGPDALKYSTTLISTWGIIGDATPNGWDASTAMEYDNATKKWTITTNLIGGKEMKFRANNAWDINLGKFDAGKKDNDYAGEKMSYNGGNIPVANSGNYVITLDLSDPRGYTYSIVAK